MKKDPAIFEGHEIRRIYDEKTETWFFSVVEAADGKSYLTGVANAETLLRLVRSVPSPKAEPIKLWLARVGYERMQEMSDPARASRRKLSQPQRGCGWVSREGAATPLGLGISRFPFTQGSSFLATLGFEPESLWDSFAELIFTALAELSTRQIAETVNATGLAANQIAAKTGGKIAKRARLDLEAQTGQSVVTGENYLPPGRAKKLPGANEG